jgi:hypothetical protein
VGLALCRADCAVSETCLDAACLRIIFLMYYIRLSDYTATPQCACQPRATVCVFSRANRLSINAKTCFESLSTSGLRVHQVRAFPLTLRFQPAPRNWCVGPMSPLLAKEGDWGEVADAPFQTSPGPSLVRRGTSANGSLVRPTGGAPAWRGHEPFSRPVPPCGAMPHKR